MLLLPGVLGLAWGGTLDALAAGLGLTLDEIAESYERVTTDETFEVPAGTVEKGTVAGLRFEVEGMVDGEARVVVEHVTRLRDDIAPDWPQPARQGPAATAIVIEGEPRIVTDVQLRRRARRRPQHRRPGRDRDAHRQRDPRGLRGRAGPALGARPPAHPGARLIALTSSPGRAPGRRW